MHPTRFRSACRRTAAVLASLLLAGGLAVADGESAFATFDATVDPATIASGGSTLWTVAIFNNGATDHNLRFLPTLSAGALDLAATTVSQGSGCASAGGVVTCSLGTLPTGQTAYVYAVISSVGVPAGTIITAAGTARSDEGSGPVNPVTVSVVAPGALPPGSASGFVSAGKALQTAAVASPGLNTVAKFKLPKIGLGTSMSISTVPCASAECFGRVVSLTPWAGYTDPQLPVKLRIRWDASVVGTGLASNLYETVAGGVETLVPPCVFTATKAITHAPCLKKKKFLRGGDLQFVVLTLSGDPGYRRR